MPSFDIVSNVQWNEVENALQQAQKEVGQRFDFRGTETEIERTEEGITISSSTEDRALAAYDVLQDKLVKRKVSLKSVEAGDPFASGKTTRIEIKIKEGIETEHAKKLVLAIKEAKLKVQASIQEQKVRVSGKNRDDLQTTMQHVRALGLPIELQFTNFRD